MKRAVISMCLGLFLGGCGQGTNAAPLLDATFIARPSLGSSITLVLTQQGTSVSGTGSFTREAGAPGSLTVSGTAQPSGQVDLTIVFDGGQQASFSGSLSGADLSGSYTIAGSTSQVVFVKQP
jgi:hypothetical protein